MHAESPCDVVRPQASGGERLKNVERDETQMQSVRLFDLVVLHALACLLG